MQKKDLRLSLVLLTAIALTGCASAGSEPAPPQVTAPVETPQAKAVPRKPSAIRAASADELMGKTGPALRTLMGPPSLLRRDHGAEVWQYVGESCVLFAYLYPNAKGVAQVTFLDARRKTAGAVPVAACFAELAGANPTS
jgi:hypothetical protein